MSTKVVLLEKFHITSFDILIGFNHTNVFFSLVFRIICGLTAFSTKHHIVRAALEAICFQTRDILEAMNKDCGFPLSKLHVDGKMTTNNLLMQLQVSFLFQ